MYYKFYLNNPINPSRGGVWILWERRGGLNQPPSLIPYLDGQKCTYGWLFEFWTQKWVHRNMVWWIFYLHPLNNDPLQHLELTMTWGNPPNRGNSLKWVFFALELQFEAVAWFRGHAPDRSHQKGYFSFSWPFCQMTSWGV